MYLFFDLETDGLPKNKYGSLLDIDNWPRIVQIAWVVHNGNGEKIEENNFIIYPENFEISTESVLIHGISTELAKGKGIRIFQVLTDFNRDLEEITFIMTHNIDFDLPTLHAEFMRNDIKTPILDKKRFCTMKSKQIVEYCKLPNPYGSGFKWPSLLELHQVLFNETFENSHNALTDVKGCAKCFFELRKRGILETIE